MWVSSLENARRAGGATLGVDEFLNISDSARQQAHGWDPEGQNSSEDSGVTFLKLVPLDEIGCSLLIANTGRRTTMLS